MSVTDIVTTSPEGMYRAASYEHVSIAGDFAFIAGQVARDETGKLVGPGDAGAQAAQIFRNFRKILDHLGATPGQVVRITTLLADLGDSAAVAAERKAFFGEHRPPHTGYAVGLGPQVKVELEFTVYLKPAR